MSRSPTHLKTQSYVRNGIRCFRRRCFVVSVFALVSRRVERFNVTAPMAFVAAGLLIGATRTELSLRQICRTLLECGLNSTARRSTPRPLNRKKKQRSRSYAEAKRNTLAYPVAAISDAEKVEPDKEARQISVNPLSKRLFLGHIIGREGSTDTVSGSRQS
jgi:hypothetical protein